MEEIALIVQYTYKQITRTLLMAEGRWKCFRCNLTFKDENIANMHKKISKHSITKVKQIVA
ncbi:MAG: hypothetical protein KGZ37_10965 [Nitrosarchaeum sp.]|nr:hypothetical protein [Nitrosarchaeum sp.]